VQAWKGEKNWCQVLPFAPDPFNIKTDGVSQLDLEQSIKNIH